MGFFSMSVPPVVKGQCHGHAVSPAGDRKQDRMGPWIKAERINQRDAALNGLIRGKQP
jgi:hypothetical protein